LIFITFLCFLLYLLLTVPPNSQTTPLHLTIMQPLTLIVASVALVGFGILSLFNALQRRQAWHKNKSSEPPGPALVPWVGRIHDLPVEYMWLKFKEWADVYGPLYRTQMLGDYFIIVTDEKVAEDLLVKRGKIYSDRPQIRSLFDPKSTNGSMEYLPLMGKNGTFTIKQFAGECQC
jgi:hypothetical protein